MQQLMSNSLMSSKPPSINCEERGQGEQNHKSEKSTSIKFRTVRSSDNLGLIKGVETNSSKRYSYSRVAARRFSSTHIVGVGNVKPFDLRGVDSSAVISAGSLSSPCINFFASHTDVHREFGADLRNLIPADSDFTKWVSDCDALIEDSHLWANEAEVKEEADQKRPTQGHIEAVKSFYEETLCSETTTKKIDETGKEVTTSRTVDLRVSHTSSLSRKVVR